MVGLFLVLQTAKANLELSVFEKRKNPKTRRITSESKEESPVHFDGENIWVNRYR